MISNRLNQKQLDDETQETEEDKIEQITLDQIDVRRDIMDIEFNVAEDLHSDEAEGDNVKSVLIEEWTENILKVKIVFDNPFAVSSGKTRDHLDIKILKPEYFESKVGGLILMPRHTMFSKTLPPQLPDGVSAESIAETAAKMENVMKSLLVVQIVA